MSHLIHLLTALTKACKLGCKAEVDTNSTGTPIWSKEKLPEDMSAMPPASLESSDVSFMVVLARRTFCTSPSRLKRAACRFAAPRTSHLLSTTTRGSARLHTALWESTSKRMPAASLQCSCMAVASSTQTSTPAEPASTSSCARRRPEPGTSTSSTLNPRGESALSPGSVHVAVVVCIDGSVGARRPKRICSARAVLPPPSGPNRTTRLPRDRLPLLKKRTTARQTRQTRKARYILGMRRGWGTRRRRHFNAGEVQELEGGGSKRVERCAKELGFAAPTREPSGESCWATPVGL
mmetsp:Transcript_57390/g.131738  ORF Transcript_57390/g.131738 Transcript_57390/m.131738 type:complete len:294 (-) Transcript_57390:12-893(-)